MQLYYYNGQPTTYFITEDGKCYNEKTNRWMKGTISKSGYLVYTIKLSSNESKKLFAHRMVMETFCPREDSYYLVVNHKDFNPLNNHLGNLEWCSQSDNIYYSKQRGRYLKREVYCFNEERELVKIWKSLDEIKQEKGFQIGNISYNAKQEEKIKINGFYWSYENNPNFKIKVNLNSGKGKEVYQYDLSNKLIAIHPSIAEAARQVKGTHSHISEACGGKLKTYKGYKWSFSMNDIV